jgi:hypothetical protein
MTIIPWADRGPATSLSLEQLAGYLVQSWTAEFGSPLSRAAAELLAAQILLETDWTRAMWLYNWGNITAGKSWTGDAWRPSWFELTSDSSARNRTLHEQMIAGKAPSLFRAYNSHEEGSRDYLRLLSTQFRGILAAAEAGDLAAFSEAVRTTGYCPDCGAGFERSIRSIRDKLRALGVFDSNTWGGVTAPTVGADFLRTVAPIAGVLVLAAAAGYATHKRRVFLPAPQPTPFDRFDLDNRFDRG